MSDVQVSDLHAAAAGLIALVDAPGSIEDYSNAVSAVRDALAAEDAAGGPVTTPPAEPVAPVVEEPAPSPVLATHDVTPPIEQSVAEEPAPAEPAPAPEPAPEAAPAPAPSVETAVANATAAIAAVPVVDDKAAHLAAAHADLDAALAEWPDSPQLQDLKTQLDALSV